MTYTVLKKAQFCALYRKVFDEDGKIRNCGRDACKELILACLDIDPKSERNYGNPDSGMLNPGPVQWLYEKLNKVS